jgi:hypothetical protein
MDRVTAIDHVTAGTKLDDYIEEVRSGYNDEQRARLDAVMRHYDLISQQLEQRLNAGAETSGGVAAAGRARPPERSPGCRPGR